jgi:hypothetical protein
MSDKIAISKEELQEQRKHYERYRERAVLVSKSQLNSDLRVCPRTSSGITEFSQHEAD